MISNSKFASMAKGFLGCTSQHQAALILMEDPDLRENGQKTFARVEERLQTMAAAEEKIAVNPNLSTTGRTAAIVELAKSTLAALSFLEEKAKDLDGNYNSLHARLFAIPAAPKGQDPVIDALRQYEMRNSLRSLPSWELMTRYHVAVGRDEFELIRAIKLAPGDPLVEASFMDRVDREHLEATAPKDMGRLRDLDALRAQFHDLADKLTRWLSGYGVELKPYAVPTSRRDDLAGPNRWDPRAVPKSAADRPAESPLT